MAKKIKSTYSFKPARRKQPMVQPAGASPSPEPMTPSPKSAVRKPARRR